MSTQRLTIDLKKNTKVAELITDLEPGENIYSKLSIVSKDEQSLVVEIEAVAEAASELDGEDEDDDAEDDAEDDGEDDSETEKPSPFGATD